MYKGAHQLTVDDKGRIAVPARFRESLLAQCEGLMVVTAYYNRSLVIYPQQEWKVLEPQLQELPSANPANRVLQEMLLGYADERVLDSQGRLMLSPKLRKYARLERDATLIGQIRKLVLWAEQGDEERYLDWDRVLDDPGSSGTLNDLNL